MNSVEPKPPDPYKCVKIPLKNILKYPDPDLQRFDEIVQRTNRVIIKSYQVLRLYILVHYNKTGNVPKVTKALISTIQSAIVPAKIGRKCEGNNLSTKGVITQLLNKYNITTENGLNLSQIRKRETTRMVTAFETNIKTHFFDYVRRFINGYFAYHLDA